VRALAPDAVIVRPPVVYGPRDTDVFQLLRSISKAGYSKSRRRAVVQRHLCRGPGGGPAGSPARGGRPRLLPGASQPVSWSELGSAAAHIMARRPRVVRVPPLVAYAVGLGAEAWSHITRRPGIISREKVAEARCRLVDLRYPARRRRTGVRGADAAGCRPRPNPRLVQGGRLADVLRNGTRFWAVDKLFMVYVVFSSVLVLGWWNQIPNAAVYSPCTLAGAALLVFEVKFPMGQAGFSTTCIRCLT